MTLRILAFLACLLLGAGFGGWVGGDRGIELGIAAGALLWFVLSTTQGLRALRWLRHGELAGAPRLRGLWGEAVDRARRLLVQRERELQAARGQLEDFLSAIRASPNGVVLLDPEGRIEWCNDTAAAQLGLDPVGDRLQHIPNLVRDPQFSSYWHARNYQQSVVMAAPGSTSARPAKLEIRLHPYGQGRLLLLTRDVTALEQAETMRRDFVANVSHEIRTPLTVLAGFVETLQNLELGDEERRHYLQLMARQAQRMQSLVSDLLTLSRLEGSPLPGSAEWTALSLLLSHGEQDATGLAASLGKPLQIRVEPAPALEVSGSQHELLSALCNLVSNAVRYTPAGEQVHVGARMLQDGRLELYVRDTGPGIAAEHLPRLTERFYRVDRSRSRETGGTGLGLAIVKHVVQRHGGELLIDSRPGVGSTFAIRLPAQRVRAVAPAALAA